MTARLHEIQQTLLAWGDDHRRDLPWRTTRDPWLILISEVMLQQTQVDRVIPKYLEFTALFPTTQACAAATPAAVISQWTGLGYNRRAVMLHRTAQMVENELGGAFPQTLPELLALPGVGPYTARAVLAFAYEADAAPLDTNIGRIFARLEGRTFSVRDAQAHADAALPAGHSWSWNQMLMDFGSTRCTKRAPKCGQCEVQTLCHWRGAGPDPSVKSAGVSQPQSTFAGSDRQGRGRLIRALAAGPISRDELAVTMGWPEDPDRSERVLDGLIRDGLVECLTGSVALCGESGLAE